VFSYLDEAKLSRRLQDYEKNVRDLATDAKSAQEAIEERLLRHLRRPAHAPSRGFKSPGCPIERWIAGLFYQIVIRHGGRLTVNKNLADQLERAGTLPAFILELRPYLPSAFNFNRLSAGAFAAIKGQIDRSLGKKTINPAAHHLISQIPS
jgi:hypothetical protein